MKGRGELEVEEEGGGALRTISMTRGQGGEQWNRTSAVQISLAASSSNRTKAVHLLKLAEHSMSYAHADGREQSKRS